MGLVEIIPNLSEGRSRERIGTLAASFTSVSGLRLLDEHSDPSHHRTVFTAVARSEDAFEASLALAEKAIGLLDLRRYESVHPTMGALDVLPFLPLDDQRDAAVELGRRIGAELARRFSLPVFLYGEAALEDSHRELSVIRRSGLQSVASRMASLELRPDFGPSRPHPTAGVTAVGVRDFLIAYNVNLASRDLQAAMAIAREVRTSSGGLDAVKAMGVLLAHLDCVQVSMNLTDFKRTSIRTAFETVQTAARRRGLLVASSEIVGLIPEAAAFEGMERVLKLTEPPRILERLL